MDLLCVLSTGSTAGRWNHLRQLFCELMTGLLFQRKVFGVLSDPRVMLASLQVCKREYPDIISGETVGFIARACSDCLGSHENVCRRITMGNKRRKNMWYQKRLKELFLFSLAKWRLEGIQLLSVKMQWEEWGYSKNSKNVTRTKGIWMGQEQNQARNGKVSLHH